MLKHVIPVIAKARADSELAHRTHSYIRSHPQAAAWYWLALEEYAVAKAEWPQLRVANKSERFP